MNVFFNMDFLYLHNISAGIVCLHKVIINIVSLVMKYNFETRIIHLYLW